MPFAFGGYLLYREASKGHWPLVAASAAVVLLIRFRSAIFAWFEQRRSR